jgi:C6 transcription factor Pro1
MPALNVPLTQPTIPRLPSPPRRTVPFPPHRPYPSISAYTTLPTSDARGESCATPYANFRQLQPQPLQRPPALPVPPPPPPVNTFLNRVALDPEPLEEEDKDDEGISPTFDLQSSTADFVIASNSMPFPLDSTNPQDQEFGPWPLVISGAQIAAHSPSSPLLFDNQPFEDYQALFPTLIPISPFTRLQDKYVHYYFQRVSNMQYLFAPRRIAGEMHALILKNPSGIVTNAISTLAALHDGLWRAVDENNASKDHATQEIIMNFLNKVGEQVMQAQQQSGGYIPPEVAVAALHLISYSLFHGGGSGWQLPLEIAGTWFEQSGVVGNPSVSDEPILPPPEYTMNGLARLQLLFQMDVISAFCAKTVMWMDIFAAVSQRTTPRFMSLYPVLFNFGLTSRMMATTNGASNEVMLAFAEIASLAHWREENKLSLSMRDLVARADAIEQSLRQVDLSIPPPLPQVNITPIFEEPGPMPMIEGNIMTDSARRELAGRIFQQAALLYLYTVVSGCNPKVPEIQAAVQAMMELLQGLPSSDVDRSLVFPICIAGCLADLPAQRTFFSQRLEQKGSPVGNVGMALLLMTEVWARRDGSCGQVVSWQDVMKELGHDLLLV